MFILLEIKILGDSYLREQLQSRTTLPITADLHVQYNAPSITTVTNTSQVNKAERISIFTCKESAVLFVITGVHLIADTRFNCSAQQASLINTAQ